MGILDELVLFVNNDPALMLFEDGATQDSIKLSSRCSKLGLRVDE